MTKAKVKIVKYDMDRTTKRNRKNFLVNGKTEADVISQLEKIHKGEKVVSIHELVWDEEQIEENERAAEEKKNMLFTGEVKFFDEEKGFGFITPDEDIDDLFFHKSALAGVVLRESDIVEFEIGEGPKGPCAVRINLIDE